MNHFYIIFVLYSTTVISFSSEEEVHVEGPSDKSVKSSYTYSIEYSDAGNHGNYGHKIEVTDGNAKVNVHAEHPQIEEQIKQQKIRSQSKPNHMKQQVLAYVPTQQTQTVVPHQKEQHKSVQLVQVQKAPSSEKLPIETLDKHQLAILLAQNKNPFLPLNKHKDEKVFQPKKPSVTNTPENQNNVPYYVAQGYNHNQLPAQSLKDASAYLDPRIQYTYQYQQNPVKNNVVHDSRVQYASVPNQHYYYPETTQLKNNQVYQNYYQHQISPTTHPTATAQPQVQYTVPFAHHQQHPQQYVYLQQAVPQTSEGHAQQYSFSQLQGDGQHGGPVQFLSQHQSQNSHTYPTTHLYNIPKQVNIPAGAPELSAYPPSLFSNVQYGSSMYGSSAAYGPQANIGYKPVVENPQTGKANQYETYPVTHGISYGTGGSPNIGNQIQSGLFKQSEAAVPVQDTKSSNFYAAAVNLPQEMFTNQGNTQNFAPIYYHQDTSSNVAYKQISGYSQLGQNTKQISGSVGGVQHSIDYSQLGQNTKHISGSAAVPHSIDYSQLAQNTKQVQYPVYYSNEINNEKQQINYIPNNSKTNLPFIPSKQVPSHEAGSTYVNVHKNPNFGTNLPQYYNPSPPVRHAENNVKYVYVQANGNPLPEQPK